jgi:hypothetical protein
MTVKEDSKVPDMEKICKIIQALKSEEPDNHGQLDTAELDESIDYLKNLMEIANNEQLFTQFDMINNMLSIAIVKTDMLANPTVDADEQRLIKKQLSAFVETTLMLKNES